MNFCGNAFNFLLCLGFAFSSHIQDEPEIWRFLELEPEGTRIVSGTMVIDRLIGEYPEETEDSVYLVMKGVLVKGDTPVGGTAIYIFPVGTGGEIFLMHGVTEDGGLGVANYSARTDARGRFSIKTPVSGTIGDEPLAGYRVGIVEGAVLQATPVLLQRVNSAELRLEISGDRAMMLDLGKVSLP